MLPTRAFHTSQLVGAALLVSVLTSACGQGGPPSATATGPQAVPVKLETVGSSSIEESSEFVGNLEADRHVILRPQIDGRVIEIFAAEGDQVSVGTPIIQLRPERNQAELDAAVAGISVQRATLSNAQAEVSAAEADVSRSRAEVKQQEAELQRAQSDLELAQINFKRAEQLVAEGAQPQQELDTRTTERQTAIAARNAAQQALEAARQSLNAAQQRLQAAQTRVDEERAALSRAEADAAVVRTDLEYNRVVAPIDGVVGNIPIKVGDYVNLGDSLTTITQNDTLDLQVAIPVERRGQISLGLSVEVLDAQKQALVTGEISFISPQVEPNAQAIVAEATFPNPDGSLRDGQFVRARVIWDRRPGVLIPTTAVSRLGGQTFVFVAQEAETSQPDAPQQVAQQRPVELGGIQGNHYQVIEGVQPGETIITSGLLNLSDGAAIAPKSETSSTKTF